MIYSNVFAFTSFLSLVAAVPHNHKGAHVGAPHHKRAEVIHWDVETVMTTVTQWLPAGDSRFGTQSTQGSGGDQSTYHLYGNTAESSTASSTTLTTSTTATTSSSSSVAEAATSTSASSAYIPASSAVSSSAIVSPVSSQQSTVVPVAFTTSSTTVSSTSSVTSTSDTTTQTVTTQAAYTTPVPASSTPSSSSAPPASSSAASSSGSGTASYLNGQCSGPDNTCSGDLTTYTAGTGTCGFTDSDSDFIVALSRRSWEAVSAHTDYMTGDMLCSFCSKKISITLNGNTQTGTIRDKCNGGQCANATGNHEYDIDLSTALFNAIGGTAARGRYSPAANGGNDIVTWYFL